jgi:hypothetical protein
MLPLLPRSAWSSQVALLRVLFRASRDGSKCAKNFRLKVTLESS